MKGLKARGEFAGKTMETLLSVRNTFGFDEGTSPEVVLDTLTKAFGVAAEKIGPYGVLQDRDQSAYMVYTDQETAQNIKAQRPADVYVWPGSTAGNPPSWYNNRTP